MMEHRTTGSDHDTGSRIACIYECMEHNATSHEKDSVAGGILPVFLFQAGEFSTI